MQVPSQGTHIFTDGSKQEEGVGSAYIHYQDGLIEQEWKGRLQNHNSIFQAEVLAITAAMQHIVHNDLTHATLHTDSYSTLQALQNHQHRSPLVIALQHLLQQNSHMHTTLMWIKAHASNEGNESADRLANQAVTDSNAQQIHLQAPPSYLKGQLRSKGLQQWQEEWNHSTTGRRTYDFFPKSQHGSTHRNRSADTIYHGTRPIPQLLPKAQHLISSTDICVCGAPGNTNHYLFTCQLTKDRPLPCPTMNRDAYHRFIITQIKGPTPQPSFQPKKKLKLTKASHHQAFNFMCTRQSSLELTLPVC
ncbi:uncharacterized protein LOC118205189 [Stegodyphus dumicola]|uniref:uncharacterized protein LOC118205189 n=1 Tax=Stegodyphus dumicola TaxID=202533 RepID=UPI0015B2407F|nr:uncharacterized protein LOC118205189 [Stegodyphus dumicola]